MCCRCTTLRRDGEGGSETDAVVVLPLPVLTGRGLGRGAGSTSTASGESPHPPRKSAATSPRTRGEVENYASATVRLAPSTRTTLTRLPAGASGPATCQMVSSIRTVPVPSMIGFSSVNTRPTSAAARLLRNGLLALVELLLLARRSHTGTAIAANTANIRSCVCQIGC